MQIKRCKILSPTTLMTISYGMYKWRYIKGRNQHPGISSDSKSMSVGEGTNQWTMFDHRKKKLDSNKKRINCRKQWEQLVTQALPLYKQTNQEDNTRLLPFNFVIVRLPCPVSKTQMGPILYIIIIILYTPKFTSSSQITYLA